MLPASLVKSIPLVLLILTWVLSAELVQGLQDGWSRPFALTYAIHCGYALSLIPYYFLRRTRLARGPSTPSPPDVTNFHLFSGTLFLSIVSSATALSWYHSLSGTSVAGNSAVYQASSAFALIFSACILHERVTAPKVTAVSIALCGVALVALGAPPGGRDTTMGYIWVTISTALYGFYEVMYSKLFVVINNNASEGNIQSNTTTSTTTNASNEEYEGEERQSSSSTDNGIYIPLSSTTTNNSGTSGSGSVGGSLLSAESSALVLGCMGLWTLVSQWPFFFIFAAAGLEPFEPSPPPSKIHGIATAIVLDFIFNVSLLWGISTSTPFAMSLSTTLVVPATVLTDWLLHSILPSALSMTGTLLILLAVTILLLPEGFWRTQCRRYFNHQSSNDLLTKPLTNP